MIATRNNLPLLEDYHGGISAFEAGWLQAALERAAIKAGFVEWWLADHVTTSVCSYLGTIYTKNVVGLGRLQEAVQQALRDIGYGEIARCFLADAPDCRISLLRLAETVAGSQPGGFYKVLSARIEELHRTRAVSFHFTDLQASLRYLAGVGTVTGTGDIPKPEEMVNFIRAGISSLDWKREVNCSVS